MALFGIIAKKWRKAYPEGKGNSGGMPQWKALIRDSSTRACHKLCASATS